MKIVVITGSTRGIGYGLAASFLDLGCAVTISGRTPEAVDKAVAALSANHPAERILGCPCDVTDFEQVQALWDASMARFSRVDIWVNNAGLSHGQLSFWEIPVKRIEATVNTNVLGTLYGSKVALLGMLRQGFGALYNMEGLGGGGPKIAGTSVYATSKAGLRYFDEMLAKELSSTPVIVGSLNPGMVVTDLVTSPYDGKPEEWERVKPVFNIISDRVETVTPWLAKKMLDNDRNGARIAWASSWKIGLRFIKSLFSKRDLFDE